MIMALWFEECLHGMWSEYATAQQIVVSGIPFAYVASIFETEC